MAPHKLLPYTYSKFLSSEMFTLLAGPSLKPFRVHKKLLAEISDELKGHVYNQMREGLEGSMEMSHVSEGTMCQFLEFCYTGDYPEIVKQEKDEADEVGETSTMGFSRRNAGSAKKLYPNAELYVFGDMYNIPRLKDIAFGNITALIRDMGYIDSGQAEVLEAYIKLFQYAFENLPDRTGCETDPLLEYLGKFAAWNLMTFRESEDFVAIFSNSERVDFLKLVLGCVKESDIAPWAKSEAESPQIYGYQERDYDGDYDGDY